MGKVWYVIFCAVVWAVSCGAEFVHPGLTMALDAKYSWSGLAAPGCEFLNLRQRLITKQARVCATWTHQSTSLRPAAFFFRCAAGKNKSRRKTGIRSNR